MDSRFSKSTFDHSSVQTHGAVSIKLLLRAGATNRLRFIAHEPSGRDLYGKTFLWFSKDDQGPSTGRTQCESETNSKDHARIRALREPARPQHLKTPSTTCQISVSSPRFCNLRPITGLEHRYHIHPSEKRLCLPSCCNGLVLSHRLSNSLETAFCLEAFEEAIASYGRPEIFNTDQGVQFTSEEFVNAVLGKSIRFSMDGRGRALDNVFVERLWRSVKYEEVYLREYKDVQETRTALGNYFHFYNTERLHQALGYKTPQEVHNGSL